MSRNQKAPLLAFVLVALVCGLVLLDTMRGDALGRPLHLFGLAAPGVSAPATHRELTESSDSSVLDESGAGEQRSVARASELGSVGSGVSGASADADNGDRGQQSGNGGHRGTTDGPPGLRDPGRGVTNLVPDTGRPPHAGPGQLPPVADDVAVGAPPQHPVDPSDHTGVPDQLPSQAEDARHRNGGAKGKAKGKR